MRCATNYSSSARFNLMDAFFCKYVLHVATFVLKREFGSSLLPHEVEDGCATQATSGLQPVVLW